MNTKRWTAFCLIGGSLLGNAATASAQSGPVTTKVELTKRATDKKSSAGTAIADFSPVVVWLVPSDTAGATPGEKPPSRPNTQLIQRSKSFEPHLIVVEAGSTIQFPNRDPFFHNVFSLFDGKRFDLGLYEAGTAKSLRFDRVGVSYLFCNIHPEMSAVVVAVESPYYATSDKSGNISIPNVPNGRYRMRVWFERSSPEDLKGLERIVSISDASRTLETVRVADNGNMELAHKNKYGQDYVPATGPGYKRP